METATAEIKTSRSTRLYEILIVILLVAIVAGGAVAVIFLQKDARQDALTAQQMAQLQSQLDEQTAARQADASLIQEQESAIGLRDEQIRQQESTIQDLQSQLVLKRQWEEELRRQQEAAQQPSQPEQPTALDFPASTAGRLVALTFDDGPGPYTAQLLDALRDRGVKATFFVLGSRAAQYPDLIRRMEAEGHVVGNHSYGHGNLRRMSLAGVTNEMNRAVDVLTPLLGHRPVVMRAPGGNYNNTVKQYDCNEGVPIIQWGVDTRDWESRNVEAILNQAFYGNNSIKEGSIVLMHDIYSTTVQAAIRMVDTLLEQGYSFATVPEILVAREGEVYAGEVYY